MTLLNGKQSDGSLSQDSLEIMNKGFSLEIDYPSYPVMKSLLFHANKDVIYRVLLAHHLKLFKKCDALTLICRCHMERGGNYILWQIEFRGCLNFRGIFCLHFCLFFR